MQYLFIVIAVVAIVLFSAAHGLTSIGQFMDYTRDGMLSLIMWLAVVIVLMGVVLVVLRWGRR